MNSDLRIIIIAGDSAGGGLALSTLLALRENRIKLPAAAICLSPVTDLAQTGKSVITKAASDALLSSELLNFCFYNYIGADENKMNPLVSPLYADLTGMPPLLIMVGTAEILLDDSIRLARKAKECGVDVDIVVADEMIHVWSFFAGIIPEGQEAIENMGVFIRKHLTQRK